MFIQLPGSERLLNLAMVREIKIMPDHAEGYNVVAVDMLGKNKPISLCHNYDEAWTVCTTIRHKMEDRGLIVEV